ncbi:hypothetical protein KB205_13420 [Microvirga sp. STS03]|uniref:Polysaccharide biosynthesis protein n=1 Tax=Pontibacter populi TaxID=890055 RepID=A0ABS6XDT2_9BACT|nr:hypothetical protein [Microvirga sp. STS03]MBW3366056.1 hypothetical protein [Pontibacter populi]
MSWMFIGNSVYAMCQWLQLSLIAKFCQPFELGSYTIALAISAPVLLFTGLQLRAIQVTDNNGEWQFGHYLGLRVITSVLGIATIIALSLFLDWENKMLLYLISILKILEGISEIFNTKQQALERMEEVAKSYILKGVGTTFALYTGVFLLKDINIGLFIAVVLNVLIIYLYDYRSCSSLLTEDKVLRFEWRLLKQLAVKAFPLGLVVLIISLNGNFSKYIIEFKLGTEKQGIYSTLSYVIVLGTFISYAVGQAFIPRLSNFYAIGDLKSFVGLVKKFVGFNWLVGVILYLSFIVLGESFLLIFFSKEIALHYKIFNLIMLSSVFILPASALGYSITAMRLFKVQPYINVCVFATNVLLCFLLIDKYELQGIVMATITATFLQIILTSFIIFRTLRVIR